MFCFICGKPIPDDVSFCPQCGAAVRRAEAVSNQAANGQSAPGAPGTTPDPAASHQAVPTPGAPVPPPRRGIPKAAVIGIAAVALVAIVAAVAAFALPGGSSARATSWAPYPFPPPTSAALSSAR